MRPHVAQTENSNKPCGLSEPLFLFWLAPWSDGIITDEGLPCQGVGGPILKQNPISSLSSLPATWGVGRRLNSSPFFGIPVPIFCVSCFRLEIQPPLYVPI